VIVIGLRKPKPGKKWGKRGERTGDFARRDKKERIRCLLADIQSRHEFRKKEGGGKKRKEDRKGRPLNPIRFVLNGVGRKKRNDFIGL